MSAVTMETRALTYELEIEIAAAPESVWKSLTTEIGAWWLPDFHMSGADSKVTLDPVAGGLLVEKNEDGNSLLWYTVQMVVAGQALYLVGHIAPDWNGPSTSMLRLSVEASAGGTLFRLRDSIMGNVTEASAENQKGGWQQLFEEGLKPFAEGR